MTGDEATIDATVDATDGEELVPGEVPAPVGFPPAAVLTSV